MIHELIEARIGSCGCGRRRAIDRPGRDGGSQFAERQLDRGRAQPLQKLERRRIESTDALPLKIVGADHRICRVDTRRRPRDIVKHALVVLREDLIVGRPGNFQPCAHLILSLDQIGQCIDTQKGRLARLQEQQHVGHLDDAIFDRAQLFGDSDTQFA